jgi:hypothetical protein
MRAERSIVHAPMGTNGDGINLIRIALPSWKFGTSQVVDTNKDPRTTVGHFAHRKAGHAAAMGDMARELPHR